jgi:predicted Zn-dependent protease
MAVTAAPVVSLAQNSGKISLIRDAEIENTIRIYAMPVLEAAGLDPHALSVHLVLDDRLNAFVAGGQRIFINTGLLRNAETANSIIGVLAHETGHIAGGHLVQMNENMRKATAQSLVALVLGAVAAGVSGRPEALIAGASAGQSSATGAFLHYTRSMESQADQAALRYLEQTGQSATGLLDILNRLQNQELLAAGRQDPYLRTHPLSQERISTVRAHVKTSRFSDSPSSEVVDYVHRRMRGKLNGFIDPPERTLANYKGNDVEARYARAFALQKLHRTDEALALIESLLAERPDDQFFHETRGYILWKAGRIADSIPSFRKSVELSNGLPLLRIGLAQALLEIEGPAAASEAVEQLTAAIQHEQRTPRIWRLMATGYGRMEDFGAASYALAEEALLLRDIAGANHHLAKALELLPPGSPLHSRALDIRYLLDGMDKPG